MSLKEVVENEQSQVQRGISVYKLVDYICVGAFGTGLLSSAAGLFAENPGKIISGGMLTVATSGLVYKVNDIIYRRRN